MNVCILYRPNTEHETKVLEYQHDFQRVTGHSMELINLDTIEGSSKAKLYDVVSYPAVIATRNDGQIMQVWQEDLLPTISEVSAYIDQ